MSDTAAVTPPPLSPQESRTFHINALIRTGEVDTNKISDGYHSFGQLYDARIELYIALCRNLCSGMGHEVWRSKKHSDGSSYDGWFLLGIGLTQGEQITYHLPDSKWEQCDFADTRIMAPEFDGHTSEDVLERLKTL